MSSAGRSRAFGWFFGGCLVVSLAVREGEAQNLCDPTLMARKSGEPRLAYAVRGDRCEGLYAQDVASGGVLTVISFTTGFEEFEPAAVGRLLLSWPRVAAKELRIRAQSRRPRLYYRMDTVQSLGTATYAWETNILNDLKLGKSDIGVLAWTDLTVGDRMRVVHVPLRIGTGRAAVDERYEVVLVPRSELDEVYLSVVPLDSAGRPLRPAGPPDKVGPGVYPAGRSFEARIRAPREPGLYRVEISAVQRSGAISSTDLLFFNPGRQ